MIRETHKYTNINKKSNLLQVQQAFCALLRVFFFSSTPKAFSLNDQTHHELQPIDTETHIWAPAAASRPLYYVPWSQESGLRSPLGSLYTSKNVFHWPRGVSLEERLINSSWPFSLREMHCCVRGIAVEDSDRRWVQCESPCQSNWPTPTRRTKITTYTKPPKPEHYISIYKYTIDFSYMLFKANSYEVHPVNLFIQDKKVTGI